MRATGIAPPPVRRVCGTWFEIVTRRSGSGSGRIPTLLVVARTPPADTRHSTDPTAEKVKLAARTVDVFPEDVDKSECQLSHTRPVWRLEDGRAVLIAYNIYRGSNDRYGIIPGVLGRSEFGCTANAEDPRLELSKDCFGLAKDAIEAAILRRAAGKSEPVPKAAPKPGPAPKPAPAPAPAPASGAASRTPAEILNPGGSPLGRPGASVGIRRENGGLPAAQKMFDELAAGGKDITPPGYPGKLVELPGGGIVGLRPVSSSRDKSPSIDIKNVPGVTYEKIHFEP